MSDRRVALLRGINVGTAKRVAMADLRQVFADLGYGEVRTLLNSGNVVFTVPSGAAPDHAARIEKAVAARLGVRARVVVLTREEVAAALEANPLAAPAHDPARLLIVALADAPAVARVQALLDTSWSPEALALGARWAYVWCARGIAGSRLWAAVNRAAGEAATARNLATVTKLEALLSDGDDDGGRGVPSGR